MSGERRRQRRPANFDPTPHGNTRPPQQARSASPGTTQPPKRQKTTGSHGSRTNAASPQTTRSLSPLERLPTEILEMIFEQSFNVSLAQSFGVIGVKLSSPASIRRFCHVVFCEVKDAFRNVYFVGSGVIGEDVGHWRRAREQVLRCRFMNDLFFKDLAGKIEGEERQRLIKVSSFKNPTSKPKFNQFLPIKVYFAYCKIPMTSIRKKGSPEQQVGLLKALYSRGVSLDCKSSMSGELLLELWQECVAARNVFDAFEVVEIMQDNKVTISVDMMLWSVQSISQWWRQTFFPFTCDIVGSVAGICHDDARLTASLKAHGWACEHCENLPVREEERRRASVSRFLDRYHIRREPDSDS